MRRVVKPITNIADMIADGVAKEIEPDLVSDVSISQLIDNGLVTLHREMKNIMVMSSKGKLDPNSARDLRDHLKLLFELKDREEDGLKGLTDEQLEAIARTTLDAKKAPNEE